MNVRMSATNNCDSMAASIKPNTLASLVNPTAFVELLRCLQQYSTRYHDSTTQTDITFIRLHRSIVVPHVVSTATLDRYLAKLVLYRKLASFKANLARTVSAEVASSLEAIERSHTKERETNRQTLLINRNGRLCACISYLFFSIEHSCKIACALGNPALASKIARDEITGHGDVFRILRNLGAQNFRLDFRALWRIYAYVIKTRMAADYTDFFYESFDPMYFLVMLTTTAEDILNSQKKLLYECEGV